MINVDKTDSDCLWFLDGGHCDYDESSDHQCDTKLCPMRGKPCAGSLTTNWQLFKGFLKVIGALAAIAAFNLILRLGCAVTESGPQPQPNPNYGPNAFTPR